MRPRQHCGTGPRHVTREPEAPRYGEVWLLDLGDPIGHEAAFWRPALVVSDDRANRHGLVTVCPIGRTQRDYPTRIEIEPGRSGLDEISCVQAEQIRTVSTARLVRCLGVADLPVTHAVARVLRMLLRL